MDRVAFKMKLFDGFLPEYKKRHDKIWPELTTLLKSVGVNNYSIFIEEDTNYLFCTLKISDRKLLDTLPRHEIMQKWWASLANLMECNPDNSPVCIPLTEVFHLD